MIIKKCPGCRNDFKARSHLHVYCTGECLITTRETARLDKEAITEKVCRSCPEKGLQSVKRFYMNGYGHAVQDCKMCVSAKMKIKYLAQRDVILAKNTARAKVRREKLKAMRTL